MSKALVLGGGGSFGAYEIGVFKALIELDKHYDMIVGTSVGALNGALIAQGDYMAALSIWKTLDTKMIFDIDVSNTATTKISNSQTAFLYAKELIKNGGADSTPLKKLLTQHIDEEKIKNSPIDYGLVTTKLTNLEPVLLFKDEIENGKLIDYMMASASCFPAVKPTNIDGINYIDGGYFDVIPQEMAINRGATELLVVDIGKIGLVRRVKNAKNIKIDTIKSNWDLGNFLLFNQDDIEKNINLGYLDTLKHFKKYSGFYYCFSDNKSLNNENITTLFSAFCNVLINKTNSIVLNTSKLTLLKTIGEMNLSLTVSNIYKTAMEWCGKIFSLDYTVIYSENTYANNIKSLFYIYHSQFMNEIKNNNISIKNLKTQDLPSLFKLLNRKSITILLLNILHQSTISEIQYIFSLGLLFPSELLSAFYLYELKLILI